TTKRVAPAPPLPPPPPTARVRMPSTTRLPAATTRSCPGQPACSPHSGESPAARCDSSMLTFGDLVEHTAVGEIGRLRLAPIAELFGQGEGFHRRELRGVTIGHRGQPRPEEMLGGQRLPLRAVEKLQIRL